MYGNAIFCHRHPFDGEVNQNNVSYTIRYAE